MEVLQCVNNFNDITLLSAVLKMTCMVKLNKSKELQELGTLSMCFQNMGSWLEERGLPCNLTSCFVKPPGPGLLPRLANSRVRNSKRFGGGWSLGRAECGERVDLEGV